MNITNKYKLTVVARLFSGFESILDDHKWYHSGSPAYYHFISIIDTSDLFEYQLFLLSPKKNKQKTIQTIVLDNLNRPVIYIPYYSMFLSNKLSIIKKIEPFYNKIIQYISVFRFSKTADCYYIDRENLLLTALLLLFKNVNIVSRLLGVTDSIYRHLVERNNLYSKILRWVFGHERSYFVCTNDGSYAELVKETFASKRFYLMFNGVDKSLLNLHNVETDDFKLRIVYLSRIEPSKGHVDFINAVAMSGVAEFLEIIIVGDGALFEEMEELVQRCDLDSAVTFTGGLQHNAAMEYLIKSDLFISINYQGSFGNGVLEAINVGLPVITLSHEGCLTLEQNLLTVVQKDNNVQENTARIISNFVRDKKMRKRMRDNSIKFSERNLKSWDERINNELNIIKSICSIT